MINRWIHSLHIKCYIDKITLLITFWITCKWSHFQSNFPSTGRFGLCVSQRLTCFLALKRNIKVVRMLIKSFGNDWLSRRAHVGVEECFSILEYCISTAFSDELLYCSDVTLRSEVSTGQCKITNDAFTSVYLQTVGEPENKSLLLCIQTARKWSPLRWRATPTTQVRTEFDQQSVYFSRTGRNKHAAVCSESSSGSNTSTELLIRPQRLITCCVPGLHATRIDLKVMEYKADNDKFCCGVNILQHLLV